MLRRFFLPGFLQSSMIVIGDDARHMTTVLRLGIGDQVILVDEAGQAAIAEIMSLNGEQVLLDLKEKIHEERESRIIVHLAQGLPKSDKMDYIVQKTVELGVGSIIPFAAEHSVVKYDPSKQKARQERWQKIASEAAKQCRRIRIPQVAPVQSLESILDKATNDTEILMLYEGQVSLGLRQALAENRSSSYLLIIGPEGGLSGREVAIALQKGARLVTMGPRILRTETAAVAAVTAVLYHHGDLGG